MACLYAMRSFPDRGWSMTLRESAQMEPPLLRTKISIPQIPPGFVSRPRLTERIQRGVAGPLTLLAAPAGFGKTHLLIEWTKESRVPVAWLTLDADDNDLSRFFRYLIGALQTLEPALGEEALDFTQSSKGGGLEVGLTLLINELTALPQGMALVLDDFQALENPAALQGVSFLLKYLPSNLHLIIASRSEPELELTLLRAKGRVAELGAQDLRFGGAEVGQYLQQTVGLQLPSETVRALQERTGGWITSLQMAAIFLKNQADPAALLANLQGEAHYLAGFLAEEVLDRQPGDVRQFLLRSSILESLTGPLCEAVVRPDAQPGYGAVMLNRLEHANLFITALDEKREWFRYHPLFAEFLRQVQTEINRAEVPELHKRAATWYEEQSGHPAEAFRHALASRDMEWAADLMDRNLRAMINSGEISALAGWIAKLPEAIVHRRPRVGMAYAWALVATYQLDLARYWVEQVLRSVEPLGGRTGPTSAVGGSEGAEGNGGVDWSEIRGGIAVCQSILALFAGDLEQAAEFSRQATRYLPAENVYLRSFLALDDSLHCIMSGDTRKAVESLRTTARIARQANNPLVLVIAACSLADMQALQGQLSKAWETLQRAQYLATGPEGKRLPQAGLADVGLGEILLERDLLEEARDYLERGWRVTRSMWYIGGLEGMASLARLRQALGDVAGAEALIAEAGRMALGQESSQWDDALVAALAARLALQREDLAGAEQWWRRGGFPDLNTPIALEAYPYQVAEYLLLTQARFLLVRGQARDLEQAAELLGTLLVDAERFQRVTAQIQILVVLALVQSARREEPAERTLLRALAMAEPESYRRIFLDEGWRLADLLRRCRSVQPASDSHLPSLAFIDRLLEASERAGRVQTSGQRSAGQAPGPTTARLDDGLPISLSAREMEVLALIADGKSNQEISAELYLALNTVKRHVYNIFAKLEVKKRTQAVSRARQLGLID